MSVNKVVNSQRSLIIINSNEEEIYQIRSLLPNQPYCLEVYRDWDESILNRMAGDSNIAWIIDLGKLDYLLAQFKGVVPVNFTNILLTHSGKLHIAHCGTTPVMINLSAKVLENHIRIDHWFEALQNPKIALSPMIYLIKFGHIFHWINSGNIDKIESQEGISIMTLISGQRIPIGQSVQSIYNHLNRAEFELEKTVIYRKNSHRHRSISSELDKLSEENSQTSHTQYFRNLFVTRFSRYWRWVAAIMLVLSFQFLFSQNSVLQATLDEAINLSQNNRYEEAETRFAELESTQIDDPFQYYLARAFNYSWSKSYGLAEQFFKQALEIHPNDLDGIIGLAYNYSWMGAHSKSASYFYKAIHLDEANYKAYLGLVYNYLSSDNQDGAQFYADEAVKLFPEAYEAHYVKGLAELHQLNTKAARKSFEQALEFNPNHVSSKEELSKLGVKATKFSVSAWYGLSESVNEMRNGLRRVDLKYQPRQDLLTYAYFDNSLILDNSFITKDKIASLVAVGVKYDWSNQFFSRLELGERIFVGEQNQHLFSLENVFFINSRIALKNLLQYDHRAGNPFGLISLGADLGVTNFLRLEGSYFLTRSLTQDYLSNERYVVGPKLIFNSVEVTSGIYYDHIQSTELDISKWSGFYILGRISLNRNFETHLLYNHDTGLFNNEASAFGIGLTYKF